MGKALYRKYRSKSLDEVIGQKHVTDILSRALKQKNFSHAYLLTGPRGVGKTSVARIMAYEINGLPYDEEAQNLDIIEIDAASNNGVEDVRDLREKVMIAPFSADKKVYIIDEVHMLSKPAFNALLKTLEEPPEHVIFILATTNIEKLPATIISRTQRFAFRPIGIDDAVKHLESIAKKEKINITEDALRLIAERGDGSFRDSISLLDQLSSLVNSDKEKIDRPLIESLLGLAPSETIDQIIGAIDSKDIKSLIEVLNQAYNQGIDAAVLVSQLSTRLIELMPEKPALAKLLNELIEVPKSPQPRAKLLSVLGLFAAPKPLKSAPLLSPALEVTATISELEKQATEVKPSEKKLQKKASSKPSTSKTDTSILDWDKLIEFTKRNYIALYSVLSKCAHVLDDNGLTLYTNNNFYKKKLDDVRYTSLLSQCLQEVGVNNLDVHTIPTTPPIKDSQAAAVAAIMGGGVEVALDAS